jgi:hypothetical protein
MLNKFAKLILSLNNFNSSIYSTLDFSKDQTISLSLFFKLMGYLLFRVSLSPTPHRDSR